MKERIVGTLRRTPERTWFLLTLFVSALLGSFFQRGRMALQLYLVIPWAIGLVYSRLRGRRMAKTAANGFLLAAALLLIMIFIESNKPQSQSKDALVRWFAILIISFVALELLNAFVFK